MNFYSPAVGFILVLFCILETSSSNLPSREDEPFLINPSASETFGKRLRAVGIRKRKRIISDPDQLSSPSVDGLDPRYSRLTPAGYLPPAEEKQPSSGILDPQLPFPDEPQASSIDAQAAQAPESRLLATTRLEAAGKESSKVDEQCAHSFHSFLCSKNGTNRNRRLKVKPPATPEASFTRPTRVKPPQLRRTTTTSPRTTTEPNVDFGASFIQPSRLNPPDIAPNCSSPSNAELKKPHKPVVYPQASILLSSSRNQNVKSKQRVKDNGANGSLYSRIKPIPTQSIKTDSTFLQPSRLISNGKTKNCTSDHSNTYEADGTTILTHSKNCTCDTPKLENVDVQATFLDSTKVLAPKESPSDIEPLPAEVPSTILLPNRNIPNEADSCSHSFHSFLCKPGKGKGRRVPTIRNDQGLLAGDSSFVDPTKILPPFTTLAPRITTTEKTIPTITTETFITANIEPQAAQNPPAVILGPKSDPIHNVEHNHDHGHHGRDICSDPFHSFLCQTVDPRNRRRKYGKVPSINRPSVEDPNPRGDNTFVYSERVAPPPSTTSTPVRKVTKYYPPPTFYEVTTSSVFPSVKPIFSNYFQSSSAPTRATNTPPPIDIIPNDSIVALQKQEAKRPPCDHPTTPLQARPLPFSSQSKTTLLDSRQFPDQSTVQRLITVPTTTTTPRPAFRYTIPAILHADGTVCKNPNEHVPDNTRTLSGAASFVNVENILPSSIVPPLPLRTTARPTVPTTTTTPRPAFRYTIPTILHADGTVCKNPNEHVPENTRTLSGAASFVNVENILPSNSVSPLPVRTTARPTVPTTATTPRPVFRYTIPPTLHADGTLCKNPNEHVPDNSRSLSGEASFINAENILPSNFVQPLLVRTTARPTNTVSTNYNRVTTTTQPEVQPQAAQNSETVVRQNDADHDHEHHHHHHHEGDICKDPFHSFLCEPIKPRRRFDGQPQTSGRRRIESPPPIAGQPLRTDSTITQPIRLPPPSPISKGQNIEKYNGAPTSINEQIEGVPRNNQEPLPSRIRSKETITKQGLITANGKQYDVSPSATGISQRSGDPGYSYPRPQNALEYPQVSQISSLRRLSRNPVDERVEENTNNFSELVTQGEIEHKYEGDNNRRKYSQATNKVEVSKESGISNDRHLRWSWSPSALATSQ